MFRENTYVHKLQNSFFELSYNNLFVRERGLKFQKALNGYRKCASIAAYYGMSDVFDNLIIHLCKFSTLMTANDSEFCRHCCTQCFSYR